MSYAWHDLAGNAGVALIVGSYLALQLERISPQALAYSVLNAVGAALIAVSLLVRFNLSAFVIEIFWIAISLLGIARWLRTRRHD
jgi:multidrug transporter EmrE-like cation transporter